MSVNTEKIKVFLADPQVLFREGIHFILSGEEDFEVIGETTGNEEALSLIETNPPHVAILSIHDAKINGTDITSRIRRNMPAVFVILIMDKKEPEKVLNSLKSGASACLTKDSDPEQLLNTIRIAAQRSMPSLVRAGKAGKTQDYISRTEFNEFRDNLMAQLKSFIGELTPESQVEKAKRR